MINSVCGIRSTGRICIDLAKELDRQGYEVKIAYGRETVPKEDRCFAVRIGSKSSVNLHVLKARAFDAMGFGSRLSTERFIRWIKSFDPDVIHLHNIHGYYINIEILFDYLRTCGKKIIWTLHDSWAFTGHSAYCDAAGCEKWKSGCGSCPFKSVYPISLIDFSARNWKRKQRIFSGLERITLVTPSEWLKKSVQQSFLGEYPVLVIPNGINTDVFKPTPSDFRTRFRIGDKTMILGVASEWSKQKGLDDMVALAQTLDKERFQVVLVGLSKQQTRLMPESIISIETVDNTEELAKIYSAADVLFNPTYADNYPTVNLEAISCGTPVITYETGGSPESADFYGAIVPKGDLSAAEKYIKDTSLMKKREAFDFSKQTMLMSYVGLFN